MIANFMATLQVRLTKHNHIIQNIYKNDMYLFGVSQLTKICRPSFYNFLKNKRRN